MSSSFADALRARSDAEIARLFAARPDLLSPVPTDLSALAARASSMPSILRARDALNKFELDILTAAVSLADPFTQLDLLRATDKSAKPVLAMLEERALVYADGEKFRVPTNVRTLIGENPAGLGPLSNQKFNLDLLAAAPKGAIDLLNKMVWGPPRGQVADVKKANPTIKWLLENNFLIAFDSQTLLLPREVAMHLRGGKVFKELQVTAPEVKGTTRKQKAVDLAAIANISTFIRWAEELAHNWSDEPPSALRSGGLGVRDLKRTAEHLGIDEGCAAFVAEVLFLGGLIVIDTDDQILPTNAFDIWLTKDAEDRWHSLVTLWLETSRVAGLIGKGDSKSVAALGPELDRAGIAGLKRSLLVLMAGLPEIDPEITSLQERMKFDLPTRTNNEYITWILREAEWLGITGQGAISSFGKALISGADLGVQAALPAPVDHILIQADNSAIAPGPLTVEVANEMGTLADIESRGGATVYRFTEGSIRRALDHGKTGDSIRDFLKKTSKTPMPQPLEYLINDVAKRHGRLRVGQANSYIRCEDEGLIAQITHDKNLEDLRLRKLAPQVLIAEVEINELVTRLREASYLPAVENGTGILISAPAIRRAKSRPRPPRVIVENSAPTEKIITAAVRALRAGEKATSHKPREVPRTTANETLDLLNQFIDEQTTITIGYADSNGGVSNRLIDPLSISLGTLVARDHATGEVAQFRIPRITGVATAQPAQ
ncbi:MAG: helicase-associated domain-containing protein [Actinomycetes bacterium]